MQNELVQIVQRLSAMRNDVTGPFQVRNFDLYGITVVTVTYDQVDCTYGLFEHGSRHSFVFDDLNALAVEIYECIAAFKLAF